MQRLHSYNFSVFSSPRSSCIRNELHVILQKNLRWSRSYVDVVGRSFATAAASHAQTRFSARQTYYDVLEITDRQCDKQEIKRQFRRLAKQYHPDHLQLETKEEEEAALLKFREIREAYEILGNKWKRGLYDVDLRNASAVAVDVDEESWTDHWKNESAEEREARRGRYRRYARGERIDMPPRLIN